MPRATGSHIYTSALEKGQPGKLEKMVNVHSTHARGHAYIHTHTHTQKKKKSAEHHEGEKESGKFIKKAEDDVAFSSDETHPLHPLPSLQSLSGADTKKRTNAVHHDESKKKKKES